MMPMSRLPASVKNTLEARVEAHRKNRWPELAGFDVHYRGQFAYLNAATDEEILQLCRLRYTGSPHRWGFAIYLASRDRYEDSTLPSGLPTTPEQAIDCTCGLYLNDPTAWLEPPKD
jgi:hypothetical protein